VKKVGNLPLAINIVATHIKEFTLTPQEYLRQLDEESFDLQLLQYEDKILLQAVLIGFIALDISAQTVFSSLAFLKRKIFLRSSGVLSIDYLHENGADTTAITCYFFYRKIKE